MQKITHTIFVVILLGMGTIGLPVQPTDAVVARAVYNPPIISPAAGAVFVAGTSTTVTWNTTSIPANNESKGKLTLGYMEDGDPDEHLDVDHPLATNIDLRAGAQHVVFPDYLPSRTGYIIVLFGDSGNKSPLFTIIPKSVQKKLKRSQTLCFNLTKPRLEVINK